ncbi:MAG: response regulator [Oscillospiraceae bacterium]|jgi:DNA-binding LytR/AlgR family response regulator|nr:response regulator [Oscillospiraceae bacterium]
MELRIAVCDDDEKQLKSVDKYLKQLELDLDVNINSVMFTSGVDLINYIKENPHSLDIAILDIEMTPKDGIRTAHELRTIGERNLVIIFLTSYPEYMPLSFDVHAAHYWSKHPKMEYDTFKARFSSVYDYFFPKSNYCMFRTIDGEELCVNPEDIIYVEAILNSRNKTELIVHFSTDMEDSTIRGPFNDFMSKYGGFSFEEVIRGVAINLKYVRKFPKGAVELANGLVMPCSRIRIKLLKAKYSEYMIKQNRI